ncbi:MAG: hypothetical protein JWR15_2874 [Prosthecobacter sp.]|nr:hypothetical protein [Prosthecobacter sp.]
MASYVHQVLTSNEHVAYEARLHWIIYLSPVNLFTFWLHPYIRQATSQFAITNKRVIIKIGLISRRTLEMNLSKIESVNVNQSILARLLGYGSIVVIGTGGTREVFHDIAAPLVFRRKFQELSNP